MSIGKKSATPNFSVDTDGNVTTAGAITITAGALAGLTTASLAASTASLITSASQAKLSASFAASGSQTKALGFASESIARADTSSSIAKQGISGLQAKTTSSFNILDAGLDASGNVIRDIVGSNLSSVVASGTSGLVLSSTFLGYKTAGGTTSANFPVFIKNDGKFQFRKDDDNFIAFAGSKFSVKTDGAHITSGKLNIYASGSDSFIQMGDLTDATTTSNTNAGFFADNNGNVLIKGNVANNQFIKINSGGDIDIAGSIKITGGAAQTVFNTIGANTSSLFTSASQAKSSASFAASGSQTFATANTSSSLAGFKLPLQTQIELTSAGMNLKNQANNKTLASYGVVTELFKDGSADNKAILGGDGLVVVQGGVTSSIFGSDVTIGNTSTDGNQYIEITSNAFKLRQVASGVDPTLINIGNVTFDEPVVGGSDRLSFGTNTDVSIIAPSASFTALKVDNISPQISYAQKAFNLDSTNLRGFSYIESSSMAETDNGALRGNFRVDYTGVVNEQSTSGSYTQKASDASNDSPFRFEATYDSNNDRGIRLGELDGGVFDIKLNLNSEGSDKFANKLGSALMITVDDNTAAVASPFNDGYSFIHARGSSNNGSTTDKFQVSSSGDVIAAGNITAFGTAFASVSDRSWKKDIETFSGSLNKILELRPRKFKWKKDNKEDYGFIAQEVEKIIPNVVQSQGFSKVGKETGDNKKHKTIDYAKLTPYLVDTIQELIKRIEKLEKENKILRID